MFKRTYSTYGGETPSAKYSKRSRYAVKRVKAFRPYKNTRRNGSNGSVPRALKKDDYSGSILIPRGPSNPFPDSKIVTMRYCESFSVDAAVTGTASYFFRANSIFDPNFTGGGHQPYGHDTFLTIYNHYEVIKSFITWEFQSGIVASTTGQIVGGITVTDDTTAETDYNTIRERKNSRWMQITSDGVGKVSNSFSLKKFFPRASSTETGSLMGANPTEGAFFQCWTQHIYSGSEPANCYGQITIDYVVRLWELKDLGQS